MMNQAFEGLKVVDFSWSIIGPQVTKCLSDFGATVVKVESQRRVDITRLTVPFLDKKSGVDRSGLFAIYNTGKYSMLLDLRHPRASQALSKLVGWADIVVENFRPGVMERLGMGYDELKQWKKDIIMIRGSLQGQTGPHSLQPGYGTMMVALTGFVYLTGWPDRLPTGTSVPYTDYPGANYLVVALTAALDYRRRTGKGQCIELSEFEATATFMSQGILEYDANGQMPVALGNRHPFASPHGAFRCRGDDRWCVIAVMSEKEWQAFKKSAGNLKWLEDPRFNTLKGRKENEDELEKLIESWTTGSFDIGIMAYLQANQVPAGIVESGRDLCEDIQLKSREYFRMTDHPVVGKVPVNTHSYQLSKTPCRIKRSCLFGEHTEYVCRDLLKMTDEEFIDFYNSGVFT